MTNLTVDTAAAIIQIAIAKFDGTDYIGGPRSERALVIPLVLTAKKKRLFAWIFLYRGYGFTTVGIDFATVDGPVHREHWALVGHSVDWERHVSGALATLSAAAKTLVTQHPALQESILLDCAFNGSHWMVGISDVTARDSLGVVEVTYKK